MATINKSGIGTGNIVQAEHITRIIDALNESGSAEIIATGSFTGSFTGDGSGLSNITASFVPNFATTDLTFTSNRNHDTDGNQLNITTDNGVFEQSWFSIAPIGAPNGTWIGYDLNYVRAYSLGNDLWVNSNGIEQRPSSTTINSSGEDVDFLVKGVGQSSLFFISGSQQRISINKPNPNSTLDISGSALITGSLTVNGTTDMKDNLIITGSIDIGFFFILAPLTADPFAPVEGQVWHRGDVNQLRVFLNGTTNTINITPIL